MLGLAATGAGLAALLGSDGPVGSDPGGPRVGGGATADLPDVHAVVPEIQAFVERERGLTFAGAVEVRLLPDDEFEAALAAAEARDRDPVAVAEQEATLVALGLLPPGTDLEAEIEALLAVGVVGFYDPRTDELAVRGDAATPAVRSTLAHELVHALQDQAFDLDRPEYDERDDELPLAFTGLVEGDALVVQEAYEQQEMTAAERREARRPPGDLGALADVPPALLEAIALPYVTGPGLVTTVLEERGRPGLDALYADPPRTSEHLLHPERFLAGEPAVTVPVPEADGEPVDSGVLGEFGLALLLGGDVVAADGWGGDAYVTWRDGDTTCTRATVAADTPADAAELRVALDALADDVDPDEGALEVLGAGPVTFTSCR